MVHGKTQSHAEVFVISIFCHLKLKAMLKTAASSLSSSYWPFLLQVPLKIQNPSQKLESVLFNQAHHNSKGVFQILPQRKI